jgi:hypothetical protein
MKPMMCDAAFVALNVAVALVNLVFAAAANHHHMRHIRLVRESHVASRRPRDEQAYEAASSAHSMATALLGDARTDAGDGAPVSARGSFAVSVLELRGSPNKALLRDDKFWFFALCIAMALMRATFFLTLAVGRQDDQVFVDGVMQYAVMGPLMGTYLSALLVLWWMLVEPVCQSIAADTAPSSRLFWLLRHRVALSVAALWALVAATVAADLAAPAGVGCPIAEFGEAVIQLSVALLYVVATVIAPRQLQMFGEHRDARRTRLACMLMTATLVFRAVVEVPPVQDVLSPALSTTMMPLSVTTDVLCLTVAVATLSRIGDNS